MVNFRAKWAPSVPRIKFQPDKGNSPNTCFMIPMTISDEPTISISNYQSRLNGVGSHDISLIMLFVVETKQIFSDDVTVMTNTIYPTFGKTW